MTSASVLIYQQQNSMLRQLFEHVVRCTRRVTLLSTVLLLVDRNAFKSPTHHMPCIRRSRKAGGPDPLPLINHKYIEFLNNTDPDPLKITKPPSQHSMLGHHWHAYKTPFKWRSLAGDDGPLLVVHCNWILSALINLK